MQQVIPHSLRRLILSSGASLLLAISAFGQDLIVNGDFVDYYTPGGGNPAVTFDGWTFEGPYRGVAVGSAAISGNAAYFGSGYDDNGTTGDTLAQTISLSDTSQTYYLIFYTAGEGGTGTGGSSSDFYVEINGARVMDFANQSFGAAWVPHNISFTSPTTAVSILFGGYTPNSFTLSNVSVVPEPATWVLLILGVLGVFLAKRRRASRG